MHRISGRLLKVLCTSLALVVTTLVAPIQLEHQSAQASTVAEIKKLQQQIEEVEKNEKQAEEKRKQLKQQMEEVKEKRAKEEQALKEIETKISRTEEEIRSKEQEIEKTEKEAKKTAKELKEAEKQVKEREKLLKTRLRSIYESGGTVSYLDVLMGATSMGDFLQRLDFLGVIMETDHQILTEFIEAKKLIEEKKAELDRLLVKLDEQLTELEALRSRLRAEKKEHEVRIASLRKEEQQLEEYDEQEQQRLLELANQKSQLVREKHAAELRKMEEERRRQQEAASRSSSAKSAGQKSGGSGSGSSGGSAPSHSGGQLGWPLSPYYPINSGYRPPHRPSHYGVDMAAPRGTSIVAAEAGIVSTVVTGCKEGNKGCGGGFGNYVVITHPGGIDTLYAHASSILVSEGQRVSRGQVIAKVGNTGRSTGPHLHFEVRRDGARVNPTPYLR